MAPPRPLAAALLLALLAGCLAACAKKGAPARAGRGPSPRLEAAVAAPGAVSVATRNTTRLGGGDPASDAAAVARAVYPGLTAQTRPTLAVVVDEADWAGALAASALAGAPVGAPLLYSHGDSLPAITAETLEAIRPAGVPALGGAQVLEAGASPGLPGGLHARRLPAGEPAEVAAGVEGVLARLAGAAPREVIVVPAGAPHAMQLPAAGLAAESGAPILFVTAARIPPVTARVLESLRHPSIYVVDAAALGPVPLAELHRLGRVSTVSEGSHAGTGPGDAAENAISVARYTDGSFGWGVKEPGHGLVFVNPRRPLDGPAAAPLSASGDYAPLLLLEASGRIPPALGTYLSDIQPAYTSAPQFRPVRGVYNHGWLIGDEAAISAVTQAELDALLEISPRRQSPEEAAVAQSE
jgi:hypothetical protein